MAMWRKCEIDCGIVENVKTKTKKQQCPGGQKGDIDFGRVKKRRQQTIAGWKQMWNRCWYGEKNVKINNGRVKTEWNGL